MTKPFYNRLNEYFLNVAEVLKGEAKAASIFANTTDIGITRENVYVEFLRQHTPSKCNVFLGGFLFGEDGDESKQLDIIISTDTSPRYNFQNRDGNGKSFSPVEGCLGIASIKSKLDKDQLFDSLYGIASIPETKSIEGRINPNIKYKGYEEWPFKIIYASEGINENTILSHLNEFYLKNPQIPIYRRPNLIHVAGKYVIMRIVEGMGIRNIFNDTSINPEIGIFYPFTTNSDLQGLVWTINDLQQKSIISNHILYDYTSIINKIHG